MRKIEKRDESGYFMVNLEHHFQVLRARKKLGLWEADRKLRNQEIKDHSLVGKYLFNKSKDEWYLVEKVNKQWYGGYYYGMLVQNNGSHAFVWFKNVNCLNKTVLESIKDAQETYDFDDVQCMFKCSECGCKEFEEDLQVNEVAGPYICPNCYKETMQYFNEVTEKD